MQIFSESSREMMDKKELATAATSLFMAFDADKDNILVKSELITHLEKAEYKLYSKTSCFIF